MVDNSSMCAMINISPPIRCLIDISGKWHSQRQSSPSTKKEFELGICVDFFFGKREQSKENPKSQHKVCSPKLWSSVWGGWSSSAELLIHTFIRNVIFGYLSLVESLYQSECIQLFAGYFGRFSFRCFGKLLTQNVFSIWLWPISNCNWWIKWNLSLQPGNLMG